MKKLFVLAPCLMGLWKESVLAQDCISLEKIRSSHSKNMEKVDEPNNKHWVQKYILDRAKISSAYTYGSVRSFVDGEGKTWRDGSKHNAEIKISYEMPLNVLIPYFQNKNEANLQENSRREALEKTKFDSDNAILDWRIANNLLVRKKLELEDGTHKLSPTKKKITEFEIEEMQYKVDKWENQIKNLNGILSTSNICI